MNTIRLLAVVGVVASLVLVAPQTGAFTSAAADRSISITVVDDESAYLGIQQSPVSVGGNENRNVVLLTVTNRFSEPLELNVHITEQNPDSRPSVARANGPARLAAGAESPVAAVVTCANSTGSDTATVTLSASGDGVSVTANRTVAVDCIGTAATPSTQASGRNHTDATSTARKRYDPRINSLVASDASAR